jgi:hypothetical protein
MIQPMEPRVPCQQLWEEALSSDIDLSPSSYAWDANPPVMPDNNGYYEIAVPGKSKVV